MSLPDNHEFPSPADQERASAVGKMLHATIPPAMGFVFLLSHGEGQGVYYTSNCHRRAVCNMMREFIRQYEPQ
jgi:hypothetical protein